MPGRILALLMLSFASLFLSLPLFATASPPPGKTPAKPLLYVVAQVYFPDLPASVWSDNQAVNDMINHLNASNTHWSPWPTVVCMQFTSDDIKQAPKAFFTSQKPFSVAASMQISASQNKAINYSGALLLVTYQLYTRYEDLVPGLLSILRSPKQGQFQNVMFNFEPGSMLHLELTTAGLQILYVSMSDIQDGWSMPRKKDNINFLRLMLQLPGTPAR